MKQRTIKRHLVHSLFDGIDGTGSELTFKFRAQRKTKAGTLEYYHLEVGACRGSVKLLLNALREMHVRDKERINRELARISSEQRALVPNE
jgi:hypothetical protein